MPTVLRIEGLRFVIYPNDHTPAHVHIVGPDWEIVVNLTEVELREVHSCTLANARHALRLAAEHQDSLLNEWRRIHG